MPSVQAVCCFPCLFSSGLATVLFHPPSPPSFRVLFDQKDAEFWAERCGVRTVPALVFFKGPGVAPVVVGRAGSHKIDTLRVVKEHSWQVVQPLRARTIGPLGCSWGQDADRSSTAKLCVVLVQL